MAERAPYYAASDGISPALAVAFSCAPLLLREQMERLDSLGEQLATTVLRFQRELDESDQS